MANLIGGPKGLMARQMREGQLTHDVQTGRLGPQNDEQVLAWARELARLKRACERDTQRALEAYATFKAQALEAHAKLGQPDGWRFIDGAVHLRLNGALSVWRIHYRGRRVKVGRKETIENTPTGKFSVERYGKFCVQGPAEFMAVAVRAGMPPEEIISVLSQLAG